MRIRTLLALALLACPPAFGRFGVVPIDVVVGESVTVADATILGARTAEYRYRSHSAVCGYVYEARVAESFKGRTGDTVVFASNLSMAPGSRHLLFLRSYDGDFPSDVTVSIEDPEDPGFDAGVKKARATCLAGLPRLKSSYLHAGQFHASREQGSHFVAVSYWIGLVPELAPVTTQAAEQRLVEWSALRAWLLRNVADIVDTSHAGAGCDNACAEKMLEETGNVMQRNFEAHRGTAPGRPDAVAAIDAAQRAWQNHATDDCSASVSADTRGQRGAPTSRCRLWFTQARARELWVLRNAPATPAGTATEDCDDACLSGDLRDAVETMNLRLAGVRRGLADRPAIIAAVELGQESWNTYLQANCGSGAPGAGTTAQWCRLRLTQGRIQELYMLYPPAAD